MLALVFWKKGKRGLSKYVFADPLAGRFFYFGAPLSCLLYSFS